MKTIFNKIVLLAVAVLMTLCAPIEQDTEVLKGLQEARKNITKAEAYFLGDANKAGTDVYNLRLMSEDVSVNYKLTSTVADNAYQGHGYVVYAEFSTEQDSLLLGKFVYDAEDTDEAGTFANAYLLNLHGTANVADAAKTLIEGGTITIEENKIELDLVLSNGSKVELTYAKAIEVGDPDFIREPLSEEAFEIVITSYSYETENVDANGDGKMDFSLSTLTLEGPKGTIVIDEIPDDLYPIGEEPGVPAVGEYELTDDGTYDDFTFTPGEIYKGKLYGSYVLNGSSAAFTKIWYLAAKTEMTITETAGKLKIVVNGTSVNGSTISAVYEEQDEEE